MGSGQRRSGTFLRLLRLGLDGVVNQDVHSEILSRVSQSVLGGSILCMQHKFSCISFVLLAPREKRRVRLDNKSAVVLNPRVPLLGA